MEINNLTHTVIGCAYKVHNVLGSGFLEKIYENALKIELDKLHIVAQQQKELSVWYDGIAVGLYQPDLWIDDKLIIEVKAVHNLSPQHEVQLVHYLTATNIDNGLLINFGSTVQVKRKFREYKPKLT
ncbi:MAG TPA: GxxExxY protein [Pyrinomonadaceae bacterium]|nr:GxxExxY protein [Pyrinomonadaceae bacterium]